MRAVYICGGVRTPIGKYAGGLSFMRPDDMMARVLEHLRLSMPQLDWGNVDDVLVGCANQAGEDNRNIGRMSSLLAGLPVSVPATTINRLCGSGMDAVIQAARAIKSLDANLIIAGGVESMSRAPFVIAKSESEFSRSIQSFDTTIGWRFVNPVFDQLYGTHSMGVTAENVAEKYNIDRQSQDEFALFSQQKYAAAKDKGFFVDEILPISYQYRKKTISIAEDEHPRNTNIDSLSSLAPAFKKKGSVTAGNSSGINDGAGAVVLASESVVANYGLTPLAQVIGGLSVGVEPKYMGIGPAYAAAKLLKKHNLTFADISLIELNEAFAAQALATLNFWGVSVDDERVNPNGGAIALGHPLGMSGVRLVHTAARKLKSISGQYALCTMCIGVGQGIAILIKNTN